MRLTHLDAEGRSRMVDVAEKPETARQATASAVVRMSLDTLTAIEDSSRGGNQGPRGKGDVLATARIAALTALKRTPDLVPLCHPIRLTGADVDLAIDRSIPGVSVRVSARAFDRTGVEMEAMVGASAAALTIYDMVKGLERGVEITRVRLEEKQGGRTGTWHRQSEPERAARHRKTSKSKKK